MSSFENTLMNYQIEPQLLAACHYLNAAKNKIDKVGLNNEHFEILTEKPFYLDHGMFETITLVSTEKNGSTIKNVIYRERLNWQEYQAVNQYILQIEERVNRSANNCGKEENEFSNIITERIDPYDKLSLTDNQRAELEKISNLPDDTVRKEAESDPDCKPLG